MSTRSFRLGPFEVRVAHDKGGPLAAVVRHDDDTLWITARGPGAMVGAGFQLSPPGTGEDPLRMHLHGGLFRLYTTVASDRVARLASRVCKGRELETSLDAAVVDGGDGPEVMLTGSWFADLYSGKRGDPRFAVGLRDLLLGERHVQPVRRGPEVTRELELSEGTYTLRLTVCVQVSQRPRWPWPRIVRYVHAVVVDGPDGRLAIPIPVDTDDRDEESISSLTLPAEDVELAMTELRALIERKRRLGGPGWLPSDRQPVSMSAEDFLDCASGTVE